MERSYVRRRDQGAETGKTELFDLTRDIGEQTDLSASNPAKAKELTEKLHAWQKAVNANMPEPNPDYRKPAKAGR